MLEDQNVDLGEPTAYTHTHEQPNYHQILVV
jgi:hypothetical protein